jgi:hypothetical protein
MGVDYEPLVRGPNERYDGVGRYRGFAVSIQINDLPTASNMASASGPEDIHGPEGQLLGRFIPAPKPGMSYPEIGLTDAELMRRLNDPNAEWCTPEEVMARLREIDQCSP